jgi:hypothetical protein
MWFKLKDRDEDGQAFVDWADMESAAEMTSNDRGSTIEDSLDYLPDAGQDTVCPNTGRRSGNFVGPGGHSA